MRAIALALFVAGCATSTPQPTVTSGVRLEQVDKAVSTPCMFVDEVPPVPGSWMNKTQTPAQRRAAALADLKELDEYLMTADGLLRACAKPRTEATK